MDDLFLIRLIFWIVVAFFLTCLFFHTFASAQSFTAEEAAQMYGAKYDIEPKLIKAIIYVESKNNPKAVGAAGEIGLMQLHPKYFKQVTFNIAINVETGTAYLAQLRRRCPYRVGYTWVVCYNKGLSPIDSDPTKTAYYQRVMAAYNGH